MNKTLTAGDLALAVGYGSEVGGGKTNKGKGKGKVGDKERAKAKPNLITLDDVPDPFGEPLDSPFLSEPQVSPTNARAAVPASASEGSGAKGVVNSPEQDSMPTPTSTSPPPDFLTSTPTASSAPSIPSTSSQIQPDPSATSSPPPSSSIDSSTFGPAQAFEAIWSADADEAQFKSARGWLEEPIEEAVRRLQEMGLRVDVVEAGVEPFRGGFCCHFLGVAVLF
jgi:hypothetical protein